MSEATYTTDRTDNYLTMARVMKVETDKYTMKTMKLYATGQEILDKRGAFEAGFMAGFCFRFTGEE